MGETRPCQHVRQWLASSTKLTVRYPIGKQAVIGCVRPQGGITCTDDDRHVMQLSPEVTFNLLDFRLNKIRLKVASKWILKSKQLENAVILYSIV